MSTKLSILEAWRLNWLKLAAPALHALKQGQELRHAAAWKNAQVVANFLAAVVTLAAAAGYDLGIRDQDILGIAGGIVAAINIYATIATSAKVGIPLPPIDLIAHSEPERVQPPALPPNSQIQPGPDEEQRGAACTF